MAVVKRNLPPEAELWGRSIETRLAALELSNSNLSALVASGNARVSSLLANQQAIQNSQNNILATQGFLADQTTASSNASGFFSFGGYTGTNTVSGVIAYGYDPLYDAELSVTTSSTGKLLIGITVDTILAASDQTSFSAVCRADVFTSLGTYVDYGPHVASNVNPPSTSIVTSVTSGATSQDLLALSPNTEYKIRTIRQMSGTQGSGTHCYATWYAPLITVTKIGM